MEFRGSKQTGLRSKMENDQRQNLLAILKDFFNNVASCYKEPTVVNVKARAD